MVVGTTLAALAAYLFQLIGGRVLGPVRFAPISILWTVLFLVLTVLLLPIEQFTIRRLALAQGWAGSLRSAAPAMAAVAVGSVTGVLAFALLTRESFFAGTSLYAFQAGLMIFGYVIFALGRGYLAGRRRFREYGWATAAEGVIRLAVAGIVLALFATGPSLAWSMVVAPFVVLWWRPFRPPNEDRRPAAGEEPLAEPPEEARAGRFLAGHVAANAASQTILAGGPLLVGALGGSPAAVSIFFVTFTLFRGPLSMTYSLVARVLPSFTALVARGEGTTLRRWSLRLGLGGLALSVLAGVVGWWMGPALVALFFGPGFRPSPSLAAMAASGAVAAMVSSFLNQVLIARAETARMAAAWSTALLAAGLAVVAASGPAEIQVGWGFAVGNLAALVVVMLMAGRARAAASGSTPSAGRPPSRPGSPDPRGSIGEPPPRSPW